MPESNNPKPRQIVLNLAARTDVQLFQAPAETVQVDARATINRLLQNALDAATQPGPPLDALADMPTGGFLDRRHQTIVIHGRRGSGKTTFLYNVLADLPPEQERGFSRLGVLDPTLLETKENVFITVVGLIKARVDAHFEHQLNQAGDREGLELRYKQWRSSLLELAEGLSVLDGIGQTDPTGEAWENPQYVLERGLKEAKSGSKLERRFHAFLDDSLYFIKKSAFILVLDDIDTDFKRGWPMLEMLRKYFTSRKLVVVMSGNLELYSLLVRATQWGNMPATLRLKEGKHWRHYVEMIDELQSQYLLKVLKPENRIEIKPLSYYLARPSAYAIEVAFGDQAPQMELAEFMDRVADDGFFVRGHADQDLLVDCLLRQPLRSVMQVLRAASPLVTNAEDREQALRAFHESLSTTFMEALVKKGVPFDQLNTAPANALLPLIAEYLTRNDAWPEGYRLKPEFTDDDFNLASLVLGARLARELNRAPALLLGYFIKIGGTREAILQLPARGQSVTAQAYTRFLGLDSTDSTLQIARRSLAAWRETEPTKASHMGTIALRRRIDPTSVARKFYGVELDDKRQFPMIDSARVNRHFSPYEHEAEATYGDTLRPGWHYNTLETLHDNILTPHRDYVHLPASIVIPARGEARTYLSIHNLVGLVADMLASPDPVSVLRRATQLRSYPGPPWANARGPRDTKGIDALGSGGPEVLDEGADRFHEALRAWAYATRSHHSAPGWTIPIHVAAKMWTRFFYTVRRIDEETPERDRFAGYLLHRYIVAFFNALLVEENQNHPYDAEMELTNPTNDDRNFLENLRFFDPEVHRYFASIYACPLWSHFLRPGSEVFERQRSTWDPNLSEYAKEDLLLVRFRKIHGIPEYVELRFPNLYTLLNTLPLAAD